MQTMKLLMTTFGILAVAMLGLSPTVAMAANEVGATNSMTIEGTCGITIPSGLSFGSVDAEAESGEGQLNITPTGNGNPEVDVYAMNWLDTSDDSIVIFGQNTKFSFASSTDYTLEKTAMNSTANTLIPFGTLDNALSTNSSYWQVFADMEKAHIGSVQQDMTFVVSDCVV